MTQETATDPTALPEPGPDPAPESEPAAAGPAHRVTFHSEFGRVLRTRPDWLYGMLCSWLLGLGTWGFLLVCTRPNLADPMNAVIVPVILTAVADGSLTNQLAAEPQWAAGLL
ncbi:MAG: hypothetical protein ACRDSS_06630, partial [Actinocrinis sp.]